MITRVLIAAKMVVVVRLRSMGILQAFNIGFDRRLICKRIDYGAAGGLVVRVDYVREDFRLSACSKVNQG